MPTYIIYYNQGNSNGPFDIYLSGSSGLNLYASNISKDQLVNGYTVTFPDGIPSSSVDVFDLSYGCFNDQNVIFPSPSPSKTPSISITPSKTLSVSITPTVTPSVTLTPTVTPSFTPPPTITPSVTVTPSITVTPGNSSSPTPTPSITRTPSNSVPITYTPYGTTLGYSSAYQACVVYNTSGFNGGWSYILNSSSIIVGTRIYKIDGLGNYNPFNGINKYYAMGSFSGGTVSSYQIDPNGYVTSISYIYGCQYV